MVDSILFIENMSGTIFHQILRNKYGAGKNGWQYPSLGDFKEMSKTFNQTQFNTFGILGSTRENSGIFRKNFDAKFDQIFPSSWHYIYADISKMKVSVILPIRNEKFLLIKHYNQLLIKNLMVI